MITPVKNLARKRKTITEVCRQLCSGDTINSCIFFFSSVPRLMCWPQTQWERHTQSHFLFPSQGWHLPYAHTNSMMMPFAGSNI